MVLRKNTYITIQVSIIIIYIYIYIYIYILLLYIIIYIYILRLCASRKSSKKALQSTKKFEIIKQQQQLLLGVYDYTYLFTQPYSSPETSTDTYFIIIFPFVSTRSSSPSALIYSMQNLHSPTVQGESAWLRAGRPAPAGSRFSVLYARATGGTRKTRQWRDGVLSIRELCSSLVDADTQETIGVSRGSALRPSPWCAAMMAAAGGLGWPVGTTVRLPGSPCYAVQVEQVFELHLVADVEAADGGVPPALFSPPSRDTAAALPSRETAVVSSAAAPTRAISTCTDPPASSPGRKRARFADPTRGAAPTRCPAGSLPLPLPLHATSRAAPLRRRHQHAACRAPQRSCWRSSQETPCEDRSSLACLSVGWGARWPSGRSNTSQRSALAVQIRLPTPLRGTLPVPKAGVQSAIVFTGSYLTCIEPHLHFLSPPLFLSLALLIYTHPRPEDAPCSSFEVYDLSRVKQRRSKRFTQKLTHLSRKGNEDAPHSLLPTTTTVGAVVIVVPRVQLLSFDLKARSSEDIGIALCCIAPSTQTSYRRQKVGAPRSLTDPHPRSHPLPLLPLNPKVKHRCGTTARILCDTLRHLPSIHNTGFYLTDTEEHADEAAPQRLEAEIHHCLCFTEGIVQSSYHTNGTPPPPRGATSSKAGRGRGADLGPRQHSPPRTAPPPAPLRHHHQHQSHSSSSAPGRSSPHSPSPVALMGGLPVDEPKSSVPIHAMSSILESGLVKLLHGMSYDSRDVRLGIDGTMLLEQFAKKVRRQNPLAIFTHAVPPSITQEDIPAFVRLLEELSASLDREPEAAGPRRLRPVVVFGGMTYVPGHEPQPTEVPSEPRFIHGFNVLSQSKATPDVREQAAHRFTIDEDLESAIVMELKQHVAEVLRAPYFAWTQLGSFFLPMNEYLSDVYGSLELLAFPGVTRVITYIDPVAHTMDYVVKEEVLEAARALLRPRSHCIAFGPEDLQEWIMMDSTKTPFVLDFIPPDLEKLAATVEDVGERLAGSRSGGTLSPSPQPQGSNTLTSSSGSASTGGQSSTLPTRRPNSLKRLLLHCASEEQRQRIQCNVAVLDAPVLTLTGCTLPLSVLCSSPPHCELPMCSVIGQPLPTALYYGISAGLLSPFVFSSAGQNLIINRLPLIDSPLFRSVTQRLIGVRVITAQVVRSSYGYYVPPAYFYQESVRVRRTGGDVVAQKCTPLRDYPVQSWSEQWPVCGDEYINHPRRCAGVPAAGSPLTFYDVVRFASEKLSDPNSFASSASAASAALAHLQHSASSPSISTPYAYGCEPFVLPTVPPTSTTVPECCAMALLKTLDSLGYFSHEKEGTPLALSLWGAVILDAGHEVDAGEEEHQPPPPANWSHASEYLILLIDLIRCGALNDDPIPIWITVSDKRVYPKGVRFAARLLSMLPLTLQHHRRGCMPGSRLHCAAARDAPERATEWSGPFDPEVAAFHSITRTLLHTLRETLEAMACGLFLTRTTLVPLENMVDVVAQLPFRGPLEFQTGNIILYLLLQQQQQQRRVTLAELQRVFPEWVGGRADVWWWLNFWRRAMRLVGRPETAEEVQAILSTDMIRCADELVQNALMQLLEEDNEAHVTGVCVLPERREVNPAFSHG
eukprot:gene11228-7799_t